jgi:predicted phosphodiesterase
MKIQLASDLHLEMIAHYWPGERIIEPAPGADVLILAGDIGHGDHPFEMFSKWPVPVIWVAGNHESYGEEIASGLEQMRISAKRFNIHFLENDEVVIGGVRFLGTTLWTDYKLPSLQQTQAQLMEYAGKRLNDHYQISVNRGDGRPHRLTTQDALERHMLARAWLEQEMAKPFEGKTVVVTHHGPHERSVHPRYLGNPLNAAFCSDLSDLMPGADLWVHGHTHDGFDYQVGRCWVVANPAGYILNRGFATSADRFDFENETFKKSLVLEV